MAYLRRFSALHRASVRQTPPLLPYPFKKGYLLNPTMVFVSKSGYSRIYDESSTVDEVFENWRLRYGKRYSSEEEKRNAREVFGNNAAILLQIKQEDPSYVPLWNGLMDVPLADRAGRAGFGDAGKYKPGRANGKRRPAGTTSLDKKIKSPSVPLRPPPAPTPSHVCAETCSLEHYARGTLFY